MNKPVIVLSTKEGTKFGVPLWAFSEDISLKVILKHIASAEYKKEVNIQAENGQSRIGHPTNPQNFMNRSIAREYKITFDPQQNTSSDIIELQGPTLSSALGLVNAVLQMDGTGASLKISNAEEEVKILRANTDLFFRMVQDLTQITLGNLEELSADKVAAHAEYLFLKLHPLLRSRGSQGLNLEG